MQEETCDHFHRNSQHSLRPRLGGQCGWVYHCSSPVACNDVSTLLTEWSCAGRGSDQQCVVAPYIYIYIESASALGVCTIFCMSIIVCASGVPMHVCCLCGGPRFTRGGKHKGWTEQKKQQNKLPVCQFGGIQIARHATLDASEVGDNHGWSWLGCTFILCIQ